MGCSHVVRLALDRDRGAVRLLGCHTKEFHWRKDYSGSHQPQQPARRDISGPLLPDRRSRLVPFFPPRRPTSANRPRWTVTKASRPVLVLDNPMPSRNWSERLTCLVAHAEDPDVSSAKRVRVTLLRGSLAGLRVAGRLISEDVRRSPRRSDAAREARVTNTLGMKFVPVKAGTFLMGSPKDGERSERQSRRKRLRRNSMRLRSRGTSTSGSTSRQKIGPHAGQYRPSFFYVIDP